MKSVIIYRMPNESDFYCLSSPISFSKNSKNKKGFFFSKFENGTVYSIQKYETSTNKWPNFIPFETKEPIDTEKGEYLKKVSDIINQINDKNYEKVVFSKVKLVDKKADFDLELAFNSLCKKYPKAFVYCVSSEETGTWMGASPELLLNKEKSKFKTVSLAGTRLENKEWTNKEKLEQQVVTEYITQILKPYSNSITVSNPYDLKAGKLFHLKSDISFELKNEEDMWELITNLHPTPAVCGIPKMKAKKLIMELENHNRELYTGFIGPMGINNHNSLFVNLRNMKICTSFLALYLGGGIMGNSNPENEWEETENKASTLFTIL